MRDSRASITNGITLDDGLTLGYLKVGRGPSLVLLHTIRTEHGYFRASLPHLASDFTVYAVDLPGHGRSSIDHSAKFDEPYFRGAIRCFIEGLALNGVMLVGESIGGVLALTVAGEIPERVTGVVSSNPYDFDRFYGDGVRRGNLLANIVIGSFQIPVIGAVTAAFENPLFLGIILRGGLYDKHKLPLDLLLTFDRTGRRWGYRRVERKTFAGRRSWSEARRLYSAVRVPVALVYGDHDWSRSVEREHNADFVARSRLLTLEKTGHFAWLENPATMAEIVRAAWNEAQSIQPDANRRT